MAIKQTAKYRPSLTISQIRHAIKLAKLESPISQESVNLVKTLAPFLTKIETESIEPAYVAEDKPSILDSLGAEDIFSTPSSRLESKVIYNKIAYAKYKESPESCTLEEIAAAQEHAYINDLMTPTEEAKYEAEINKLAESIRKEV